jgi:hypothetical protein
MQSSKNNNGTFTCATTWLPRWLILIIYYNHQYCHYLCHSAYMTGMKRQKSYRYHFYSCQTVEFQSHKTLCPANLQLHSFRKTATQHGPMLWIRRFIRKCPYRDLPQHKQYFPTDSTAQAIIYWPFTTGAQVLSQGQSMYDLWHKVALAQVLLWIFWFLPFGIIPPMHHAYSLITDAISS